MLFPNNIVGAVEPLKILLGGWKFIFRHSYISIAPRLMKDFVYQINNNECGYASIKMLLAIVLEDSNYLYMPHKEDKNHQYDLLELKEIAKANGVALAGYVINNQHDLLNLKTPFIFIRTLANGNKHAVVVKKIYKHFAMVYDPAIGKKLVSNKKYFAFTENVEVLTVESHSFVEQKFKVEPLIKNITRFKIVGFECLAIIFYFLAAYFLDDIYEILIPIILICVGAIFAITFQASSFNTMKRFDDTYIEFTYSNDIRKREENYKLMHKTKSGILNTTSRIFLILSSTLLINILLIIKNAISLYIIVSSLVLIVIDFLFIDPRVKSKSNDLEALENANLKDEKLSKDEYLNNYSEIKENTYKIARLLNFKRLMGYFALLVITLLISQLTDNIGVYFVIFHFAMCMFTYSSLDNVFRMVDQSKENQINQVKFYNLINEKEEK